MTQEPAKKCSFRVGYAKHKSAEYACKNWHYSKCTPRGPLFKIGVWEGGKFVGVVIFSRGANMNLSSPYGLMQTECCELTRIALREHKTPVSRIVKFAIKFLKKQNEGLRLIVSFADPEQGHHGGIYQAGNWIYSGDTAETRSYYYNGKKLHKRAASATGVGVGYSGKAASVPKFSECKLIKSAGKHRYLMPLDKEMAEQIKPLSKSYPKRDKQAMAATSSTAMVQHQSSRSTINEGFKDAG